MANQIRGVRCCGFFFFKYAAEMRVSEVIYLHYDIISHSNMQIHVRNTSGVVLCRKYS